VSPATKRATASASDTLDARRLNRALLARQLLLERQRTSVVAAVEQLAGMQAQIPRPPFVGLWTRLIGFQRETLARAFHDKSVVRATAMRGTIHVLSARDFRRIRPTLAPMLVQGAQAIVGKRTVLMTERDMFAAGRAFFAKPAPFDDFRKDLESRKGVGDVRAVAYTVRMGMPLVMVPDESTWAFASAAGFLNADIWLGTDDVDPVSIEALVLRYLAAFGPATPGDAQTWSGIRGLREAFETLRPKLLTFRDDRKRELFDLPDAPRPPSDTPAPTRFLPEFDNVLLAHDDRTRIISDAFRPAVISKNLQVRGTFLVDGFVAGMWRSERKKTTATLTLTPLARVSKTDRPDVEREGELLLAFIEADASQRSLRWET
jgi:hypothetical protein